jgi:hypothetical protein
MAGSSLGKTLFTLKASLGSRISFTLKKLYSHPLPPPLAKNRVSGDVGGVKRFLSTLQRALGAERLFALVEEVPNPTKARFAISVQVRDSVRPMHVFGRNLDHASGHESMRSRSSA